MIASVMLHMLQLTLVLKMNDIVREASTTGMPCDREL